MGTIIKNCENCRHKDIDYDKNPCRGCIKNNRWEPKYEITAFNPGDGLQSKRILIRDEIDDFNPEDYKHVRDGVSQKSRQCGYSTIHQQWLEEIINQAKGENQMKKITIGTAVKNPGEKNGELTDVTKIEVYRGMKKIEAAAKYMKSHKVDAEDMVYIEETENWREFE
jgi:hypothetical protein